MSGHSNDNISSKELWGGGRSPYGISYGKMYMWFFLVSDALTFGGLLSAYGFSRAGSENPWPIGEQVFRALPGLEGKYPLIYVALMTFILIVSSVTMVLAVEAGHRNDKKGVIRWMLATIIGGFFFLGSQAWEWKNFINGSYGAVQLNDGKIVQFTQDGHQIALADFVTAGPKVAVDHTRNNGLWFEEGQKVTTYNLAEVVAAFKANTNVNLRIEKLDPETKQKIIVSREEGLKFLERASRVVEGANLEVNEYGSSQFADFFFFITGFHGFHVVSGIVLNIIVFFNVLIGTYEKRGHYEMVEKVGLYWHFVDLVWVFVFTFFYLV